MLVRTPTDLGAVIRDRRKQLKLDQAALAKRIGVSRQWVIEIEHGHARAELALVLRALDALSIRLDASTMDQAGAHLRGSSADGRALLIVRCMRSVEGQTGRPAGRDDYPSGYPGLIFWLSNLG